MNKTILVTGGSGYIASHIIVALNTAGYNIVALDNLANSSEKILQRIYKIISHEFPFYVADIRDYAALTKILAAHKIAAVIHLAGLKAVGESVTNPLLYYDNNVCGTTTLLRALAAHGIKTLVFSSSATVYGNPQEVPIKETSQLQATNPYGNTKLIIENMLNDLAHTQTGWQVANLRYFNPVGAHASGMIGENPRGTPNNLVPFITQVAVGKLAKLRVFGNDWPTPDGTPVRDYIHVMDLANGHVAALRHLFEQEKSFTVNLGTGRGYSVLEVIHTFEKVLGRKIPHEFAARRAGDIAACYAAAELAKTLLGWTATRDIVTMCEDAWRWQQQNPNGI